MTRVLNLIGAPSSAGAYAPGQERAPAAFRRNGLIEALTEAGVNVADRGDVPGFRWRPDPFRPEAMNLETVRTTAMAVAEPVAAALAAGENVLVLGGDCTVELGTVAGALGDGASVGLVYIDLDTDLNPPGESDGALDWCGVAHMLDLPGAVAELTGLATRRPMLGAADVLFFAADNLMPNEVKTIETLGLEIIRLAAVKADPAAMARRASDWAARFDRLLVHVDVDVLEFASFPIAENVRRVPGLTLEELSAVLAVLLAAPNWRALTLTEVNPDHAPDEAESFARLIGILAACLAGRSVAG
jgi:arginase